LAGGEFAEVGADADELAKAIDEKVAAIYCTSAWFCGKEALPLGTVIEISHQSGVPVIVDAAAEVPPMENLSRFVREGADLVTFSGGKAIRGPQSSGFLLGSKDLIEACRLNDNPHMAIGRPMKVSKEEIVGLVKAIELYVAKDHAAELAVWERRVAHMINVLSNLEHVHAVRQLPFGIGQQIPHIAVTWDEQALKVTYTDMVRELLSGRPRIAVQLVILQSYASAGFKTSQVRIHPHTLCEGEDIVVAERVANVLSRC
jgi:L-seryl-tRNA(Ser) seleniumtransferase